MFIIHRDLKPENILIDKKESNGFLKIKVADFGTGKFFEKGGKQKRIVGSSYYIAPEVLAKKYNEKCDLWSCGVILYILLTSRPPFPGDKDDDIMRRVVRGKYDMTYPPMDKISTEAKNLVNSLLVLDINKRLSAEAALNHPWFKTHKSKELFNHIENSDQIKRYIQNLKTYSNDYILQETALAYLVHNNPQMEEIENACKLFNLIDSNCDGKITKQELYEGLTQHVHDTETLRNNVNAIFRNIDSDENGYLEYEEFVRAAVDKTIFLDEHFLKFAFRYFDKDSSGEITLEEIEEVFSAGMNKKKKESVQKKMKKIMAENDLNHDGKISFEEFSSFMNEILK